jgi:chromosome segregation ATPase
MDVLQRTIHDNELGQASSEKYYKAEIEHLKNENAVAQEEVVALKERNRELDRELSELKNAVGTKLKDYDRVESDYKELSIAHRALLDQQTAMTGNKEDLDVSLRTASETIAHYKDQLIKQESENAKLLSEVADYKQRFEASAKSYENDLSKSRKKTHEYKRKVRFANEKIRELGERLVAVDTERIAILRENSLSKEDKEARIREVEKERDEYKFRAYSSGASAMLGSPLME